MEQELLTLDFSGIRISQFLVFCEKFVDRCLSFYPFSFDYCIVFPSSVDIHENTNYVANNVTKINELV